MKMNKMFCIDEDLIKKLEGINASELVNKLLKEYFSADCDKNLKVLKENWAKNKQILKETRRKDKELSQLIKKIEQKETKVLNEFKQLTKIQKQTLENCKNFNPLWFKTMREHFEGFTFSQLNKLWEGLKNGNF